MGSHIPFGHAPQVLITAIARTPDDEDSAIHIAPEIESVDGTLSDAERNSS